MLQVDRIANMNMTMTCMQISASTKPCGGGGGGELVNIGGGVGFLIEFMLTKILALSRWALMLNSGGEKTL